MGKSLENMTVAEIFANIGKIITPEEIYYLINDDETLAKYTNMYKEFGRNLEEDRQRMYGFLEEHENEIDKVILVLITLELYYKGKTISKNIYEENKRIYNLKIEQCKKLLDGKDVSVYRHKVSERTGIVEDIVETSSVELCAIKSEGIEMTDNQLKLEKKRKEKDLIRRNAIEKKKNKNTERLQKINSQIPLEYILQFIVLTDIEKLLVPDEYFGTLLRFKIIRNTILKEEKMSNDELYEVLMEGDLDAAAKQIEPRLYLAEFKDTLMEYSEYFDIDKLLLCSAYRGIERLSLGGYTPEDLEGVENILKEILNQLDGKNTRISGEIESIEDNLELTEIKYDKNKIKSDLKRFVTKDIFLSDKLKKEIKQNLINENNFLKDYEMQVLSMIGFSQQEWDKIVKSSSENFMYFLDNFEYDKNDLQEIIFDVKDINTECLYKLIQMNLIDNTGIVKLCGKKKVDLNQLVELSSIGELEDEIIIDSFNELQKNIDEEFELDKDTLLEYFNIPKIEEYINNKKLNNKFLDFYLKILPEDENKRKQILDSISELVSDVTDKYVIMNLYAKKIISEDDIKDKLEEDDMVELYENNRIDINTINRLHEKNIIGEETLVLILDEEYSNSDIVKLLENEAINIKTGIKLYNELYKNKRIQNIYKGYLDGDLKTPNPALFGYAISNIDIEQINELYKKGIVKEKDLSDVSASGAFSVTKITELYVNMLISEEIIDKLTNEKIISEHDSELMKKALDMKKVVKNIDKSLGIAFGSEGEIQIDEGIFLPEEKAGKSDTIWGGNGGTGGNGTRQTKKVISPAIRERKFETYGAKRVKRNNVEYNEKSPFNDYEFYIIPDEQGNIMPNCIVIAERYYEDKYSGEEKLIDGNATYLFELKDLTRISKKSKPEILSEMKEAKDNRMKRKLHTKNWAKNIDKAIQELLGIKLETCYTEIELHDITTISELIDGFEDKGKTYRIFDVEF